MNLLKPLTLNLRAASRGHRAVCLLAVVLPALFLGAEALRVAAASTLGESADAQTLQRSLRLDPANPALEHRLGQVLFLSSAKPGKASGLAHLRRAAELEPDAALYWSDLASACEALRNLGCADLATARSLALSPQTPRLYWAAANYYLRTGRQDRALQIFRRLLVLDPEYAAPTFEVCLGVFGSARGLEETVPEAPGSPRLELALADFLSSRGDADAAFGAWQRTLADSRDQKGPPFNYSEAAPYLDRLIAGGDARQARAVWNGLESLGVVAARCSDEPGAERGAVGGQNLLFNGGFGRAPLNSGFDWRYSRSSFISLDFSAAGARPGLHGLRVEFSADRNDVYEPVWHFVPVDPERNYILSAFARSDGITSDSGPCLRVQDPWCPKCLNVAGPGTIGTTPWHEIRLAFATGPETRLIKVSIWRPRSRSFPPEIQGVYWLGGVSLVAARPAASPASRVSPGALALLKPGS